MIVKRHIMVFVMILFSSMVMAQETGEQQLITQPTPDSLLHLHIDYNKAFPVFPGFRIQLLMESGNTALQEAEQLSEEFLEKHPETACYITFREPYYRVRVGDFRTRLEADAFLSRIERKYPNAWVIQDDIHFPSLTSPLKNNSHE